MLRTILICVLAVASLAGCATVYPECEKFPEDSVKREECQFQVGEWRRGIDRENWGLCMRVIDANRGYSIHIDHRDIDHRRAWAIRQDLNDNFCRRRLGEHYAEY